MKKGIGGMFLNPTEYINEFVIKTHLKKSGIIVVLLSVVGGLGKVIEMITQNIEAQKAFDNVNEAYDFARDYVAGEKKIYSWQGIAINAGVSAAGIIISAVVMALIMKVIINSFEKNKLVLFRQSFAVVTLSLIFSVPFTFAGIAVGMSSSMIFGCVKDWFTAFGIAVGAAYMFLGIRVIEKDDNHLPLTYGLAAIGAAVISTITGFLC